MDKQYPAYVKDGKTVYFPSFPDFGQLYTETKEQRNAQRIKDIEYWFNELAEDNEQRAALCELIELCDGDVPIDVCHLCGRMPMESICNNANCS